MEIKTAGKAYARLVEENENKRNGKIRSAAPSSPSSKKQQQTTPTRGYLAQRVHAFSKQKNHRPLTKTPTNAANTKPPNRNKVLEAVQTFEAISKAASERSKPKACLIQATSIESPLQDNPVARHPPSSLVRQLFTEPTPEETNVLDDDARINEVQTDEVKPSPDRALLSESHENVNVVTASNNEPTDEEEEQADVEEEELVDQSHLLDELAAIVETIEVDDDIKLQEPGTVNQNESTRNDNEILRILGILQSQMLNCSASSEAGDTIDKAPCQSDDKTACTNNDTKSFASIESEAYETMVRLGKAFLDFSGQVSVDMHKAASKLFQRNMDKHKIAPSFKYKLLAMIRKRVAIEAAETARVKFPITSDHIISSYKITKLNGDLLVGKDEMEITRLSNKTKNIAKDAEQFDSLRRQPSLQSHLREIWDLSMFDDYRFQRSDSKGASLKPTDQEIAVLRLAPTASCDDLSEDDDEPALPVARPRHGPTSIERLMDLSPQVDPAMMFDVAMMMQTVPSSGGTHHGMVETADVSASYLDATFASHDEPSYECTMEMTRDGTVDDFDATRDGTTLLADDEATFEQEETHDEFSLQQSYSIQCLIPTNDEYSSAPFKNGSDDSSTGSDLDESQAVDVNIAMLPLIDNDDDALAKSWSDVESKTSLKSQHSGSSTEVTANGGDSRLHKDTISDSTCVPVEPINNSLISGLNSTWPSVTLFSEEDTVDDRSVLFGNSITLDFVDEETDSYSSQMSSIITESKGPAVDHILNIFRPSLFDGVNAFMQENGQHRKDDSPLTVQENELAHSGDDQEAELSSTEEAALQALIERPIINEGTIDSALDSNGNSKNISASDTESEAGGRLWKLIVAQTRIAPNESHSNVSSIKKVVVRDPSTSPSPLLNASRSLELYDIADLLPVEEDETSDEDDTSRPYVYGNPAFTDMRRILCVDDGGGFLCAGQGTIRLPWQQAEMRPTRARRNRFCRQKNPKNGPSRSFKQPVATPTGESQRCIIASLEHQKRDYSASMRSMDTRDTSPVDAGLYIAEMMGQELLQVASDLASVCDDFSKAGDSQMPIYSWLRCW
ncbi:hypothetical protein MPSEU_000244400 [Mayamaea pseudoterrestris]|nr:hypothetical protein MPSEU_000244400 [Mayamaea pseudoterrestris]